MSPFTNLLLLHTMPLLHPHFMQELTHIMLLPHPLPHPLPFTPQLTNLLQHFTLELTHTMLLPDPHSHTMPVTPLLLLLPKPSKFVQYFSTKQTNKQTNNLQTLKRPKNISAIMFFVQLHCPPTVVKKGIYFLPLLTTVETNCSE
jgi:hypothetical protein